MLVFIATVWLHFKVVFLNLHCNYASPYPDKIWNSFGKYFQGNKVIFLKSTTSKTGFQFSSISSYNWIVIFQCMFSLSFLFTPPSSSIQHEKINQRIDVCLCECTVLVCSAGETEKGKHHSLFITDFSIKSSFQIWEVPPGSQPPELSISCSCVSLLGMVLQTDQNLLLAFLHVMSG